MIVYLNIGFGKKKVKISEDVYSIAVTELRVQFINKLLLTTK